LLAAALFQSEISIFKPLQYIRFVHQLSTQSVDVLVSTDGLKHEPDLWPYWQKWWMP
jgi:hypothetical protein